MLRDMPTTPQGKLGAVKEIILIKWKKTLDFVIFLS